MLTVEKATAKGADRSTRYTCGCSAVADGMNAPAVSLCRMHDAAPALIAALETIRVTISTPITLAKVRTAQGLAIEAIRAAGVEPSGVTP
jgi:hypothetical protein